MKREIVLYWKPGPLFLDYDHIKLAAQAKGITVDDQVDLLTDKLSWIQEYFSPESGQ